LVDSKPKTFLKKMPHLMHDFQCLQAGPEYSVSLLADGAIETFASGAARNVDSLPKEIQRKLMNKMNPVPLTDAERVTVRGFESMVPFVDKKDGQSPLLPWPEPANDFYMFQFVENSPVLIPPSETVDPRADRTFGNAVMLRGRGEDDVYLAKIIKYHNDFTLVEYYNGQRQWLPLQNQQAVFATENDVGKVASCVKSVEDPCVQSVAVEGEAYDNEVKDETIQLDMMKETSFSIKSETAIVESRETSCLVATDQSSGFLHETSPATSTILTTESGGPDMAISESPTPSLRRDKTPVSEKRAASPIPRETKALKFDKISGPTVQDPYADDDSLQRVPRRERHKIGETVDTFRSVQSSSPVSRNDPCSSKAHSQNESVAARKTITYTQMKNDDLALQICRRIVRVTKAVFVELFQRPWHSVTGSSIPTTIRRLAGDRNFGNDVAKVELAWSVDRELSFLCEGARENSINNGESKIHGAVERLVAISRYPWFREALSYCRRRETLESGIVSANEYLRRANVPPIAEEDQERLIGNGFSL
jgi:hypothetical protein